MEKFDENGINQALSAIPEWKREEKFIHRRYKFPSFPSAISFVNRVAEIAEAQNHHPFISIDYKMVTIRLTSWHAGGLTQMDFDEAAKLDEVYEHIS